MITTPRYRIGNDMTVLWAINNKDGSPYDMAGKEVRLFMTHRYGREEVACSVVRLPDGSVNNVIRWDFSGDDQKVLGPYALTVRIYNAEDMKLIRKDICEAFELVAVSCMECAEGGDAVINDGGDLILSSKLDIYRFGIPKIYIGANGNWFIDGVDTGRSALGGGPGLVSRIYGKSDFGGTFDEDSVVDTFNAHAINDLAQRVAFMEGDDYLRLSNMTDVFFQGDLNDKDVLLFDGTYWTNVPLDFIITGVQEGMASSEAFEALAKRIAVFEKMFYWADEEQTTVGTKFNFFSEQENSAGGSGEEVEIPGGGGIIDEEMSDTSDNAVANRVIKAYVDAVKAELDAIIGGDATDAIESINEILAFLSTMADTETLAGIVSNLEKMISDVEENGAKYTNEAIASLRAYVDSADAEIKNRLNALEKDGSVFKFEFDSATKKATAEMVSALAEAISENKLILCDGRTYKFILEQDGMYGLVSDAYLDIMTGELKVSVLAVMSTGEVQIQEQQIEVGTQITESTVAGWGFTKNQGTITGIKMNGATKGTSGVVDLGTVITAHQQLKTINNQSLVGSGNITIQGGGATERVEMTAESASIEPNKFYVWPMMDNLDVSLGAETSGVMNRYLFQFRNPKAGVTMLTLPDTITWSEDTELDENGMPVMEAAAFYRIEVIEGLASLKKWKLVYINFADAEVERVLMANGVGDGIGITKRDAAEVTNISTWFASNKNIVHFTELQYFTGLTSLRGDAFYGCSALEEVNLDNITEFISTRQFAYCSNLKGDFTLALNTLPSQCFRATRIDSINAPLVTTIGPSAFQDCKSLKTAIFSDALTSISGGDTFYNCTALEVVDIHAIQSLAGTRHFRGCTNLKGQMELLMVSSIPSQCFWATRIDSINAPLATSIGANAFLDCKSLKTAIFGDALTSISGDALYGCSALEVVIIRAVTPPTLANARGMGGTCPIYVPDESVEAYKVANVWSSLASRIKGISEYTG